MPGNQGSIITHLLNLSQDVCKHRTATGDFSDGTAHWGNEQWLPHCHHWEQAKLINKDYFYNNIPDATWQCVDNQQGLMPFRCHPAVAIRLSQLLPALKIIHITHPNKYHSYRLYWQKLILGFNQEREWYVDSYYRSTGLKLPYLSAQIKRQLLIGWFNHYQETPIDSAYRLNLVDFWHDPATKYADMIQWLKIRPGDSKQFDHAVTDYRSKQWTRF